MSKNWFVSAEEKRSKFKPALIVLYLSRAGMATTSEIADCLDCSPNTARKLLYRMEKEGKVYSKSHYYNRGVYLLRWYLK